MNSLGTIGSKGNSPRAKSRGRERRRVVMTVSQWTAPAMRLDFRDCLQKLGANLAVCDAEWDTRVGVHHLLGKTDDEATTAAFGELYNT